MREASKFLTAGACAVLLAVGLWSAAAQAQGQPTPAQGANPARPAQQPEQPTFRLNVDLVTTDVIVRDGKDQFVADLKAGEFDIFEDGVKQEMASLVLVHGGRAFNVQAPPPPPAQEGIILPPTRPTTDTAGRVFLLFIDDLHLDFRSTPRTRDLLKRMLRNLIHEGDMFGIVTTGTSSLSIQLTYDRQVLDSAIQRVTGNALRSDEIISGQSSSRGPTELRHRAHVAFSTAYDLMKNLEQLHNRRKAVIYLSSGYDFNPFEKERIQKMNEMFNLGGDDSSIQGQVTDPFVSQQMQGAQFADADLALELSELTRAANRANASFYTIDPRGLVASPDLDEQVDMASWQDYIRRTQDSLRVLAEQTGGIAVVNQNDFDKALKRIDAETSDYYVLGYYSSNPDPLRRTRRLEVKVKRDGLNVWARSSYSLRPTPPSAATGK
jgi:VWFA-related protein